MRGFFDFLKKEKKENTGTKDVLKSSADLDVNVRRWDPKKQEHKDWKLQDKRKSV